MSKFITKIPTQVDDIRKLLPEGSDLHEVRLSEDGKQIEVEWGNDWRQTPFTVPHEWPVEFLCAGTVPEKVTIVPCGTIATPPHPPITPKKALDKTKKGDDKAGK